MNCPKLQNPPCYNHPPPPANPTNPSSLHLLHFISLLRPISPLSPSLARHGCKLINSPYMDGRIRPEIEFEFNFAGHGAAIAEIWGMGREQSSIG